jgi:hypothetical protein
MDVILAWTAWAVTTYVRAVILVGLGLMFFTIITGSM